MSTKPITPGLADRFCLSWPSVALRALRLPGAEENGPSVLEMLDARAGNDDESIEESLLKDLAEDVHANRQTIARKDRLLARAVTLLVIAIVLELAGVQ